MWVSSGSYRTVEIHVDNLSVCYIPSVFLEMDEIIVDSTLSATNRLVSFMVLEGSLTFQKELLVAFFCVCPSVLSPVKYTCLGLL